MNFKKIEREMVVLVVSTDIANEICRIVTKAYPEIWADAVHNSIEKHPELWEKVDALAKEIQEENALV